MSAVAVPTAGRRSLPLVALVLMCAVPPVAAWLFYLNPQWLPERRAVHGTLVQPPRPLPPVEFRTLADEPFPASRFSHEWSLVWVTAAGHDTSSGERLGVMRNLRLALRQDGTRLHYYAVVPAVGDVAAWSEETSRFAESTVLLASAQAAGAFALAAGTATSDATGYFVVDPLGNVMMRYDLDAPPKGILKDLERLLKYSQIGR